MTFVIWEQRPNTDHVIYDKIGETDSEIEAERVGLRHLCNGPRNGTYQTLVTEGEDIHALSMRSFQQRMLDLFWTGQPGLWNGSNGKRCEEVCANLVT